MGTQCSIKLFFKNENDISIVDCVFLGREHKAVHHFVKFCQVLHMQSCAYVRGEKI